MNKVRLNFGVKDQFKIMFDSLQEGIVVLNDGKIEFMNDLSNKFMTFLSGMSDYQTNMTEERDTSNINPLNIKIFYLFQADSNGKNKSKKDRDKRIKEK